jgi:uncharacterized protein involved in outer membrane biogenesis
MKRLILALGALLIVGATGLFVWARTVLTGDTVRTTLAAKLSEKLGQPVTIGNVGASIFPRVSLNLNHVTIGQKVSVDSLGVGTDFGALLSRRIEHATVRIDNAHVTLPLPPLPSAAPAPSPAPTPTPSSGSAVEIASIDSIVLNDVEITSGGRTLRADIDLGLQGQAATIRAFTLKADGTAVTVTGTLTDYAAPAGTLKVEASAMNVLDLVAFVTDFTKGSGVTATTPAGPVAPTAPAPNKMQLALTLAVEKATIGDLTLGAVNGQATVTDAAITVDPAHFTVFGGTYTGSLGLTLGDTPDFRVTSTLADIDMANVMTFAHHPGLVTGKMNGSLNVTGHGLTAAAVSTSAHGAARITIANGTIKGLGLVKGAILATSMRGGSASQALSSGTTEPFTSLAGTFTIANGAATTSDLAFTSSDVLLAAKGSVRLDGSSIELAGPLQLSDALSKQLGRDLVKYTQKDGRVTLPAQVTGSADNIHVSVDTADLAKRAVTNATGDAAKKLLSGIGRGRGGGGAR